MTGAWPQLDICYRCETFHYSAAVVSHKIRLETALLKTAHEDIQRICKNNIVYNIEYHMFNPDSVKL